MSTQFEHVSIAKKANIYFDGKCISYSLTFPGHARKTIGVILPSSVSFVTDGPEFWELVAGKCRVRMGEAGDWKDYESGQRFHVPGDSRFYVEAEEPVQYVCHFVND